jgi:O-antigen/teichoic acid export membrane protein
MSHTHNDFNKEIKKGIQWITISTVTVKLLQIITGIILAKLLSPSIFGLAATSLSILYFTQGVFNVGFDSALIQKDGNIEDYLNTAWTLEIFKGLIVTALLLIISPLFGILFESKQITELLFATSFIFALGGLKNIGIVYFRKNLDFYKQFLFELLPAIFNMLVSISVATKYKSPWAIILGIIVSRAVMVIMSYLLHPYRPKFEYRRDLASQLFGFGKWIMGGSILSLLRIHGVNLLIGKLYGMVNLGLFNRASYFTYDVMMQFTLIVWKLGFPLFSKIQKQKDALGNAFNNTLTIILFITSPFVIFIFILSEPFVRVLLNDEWYQLPELMRYFSVLILVNSFSTPASILFQSSGKPKISTMLSSLNFVLFIILVIPLAIYYGIQGVLMSQIISQIIILPYYFYKVKLIINLPRKLILKNTFTPLINSLITYILVIMFIDYNGIIANVKELILIAMLSILLYFSVSLVTQVTLRMNSLNILYSLWKQKY